MKRLLTAAVALICMTLNVPAQQGTSTLKQKGEKLAKAAMPTRRTGANSSMLLSFSSL